MADWTNSAKAELERYAQRVAATLAGSGADTAEVIDDLKRHVEADVLNADLKIVTEEDVRRILARIGEPGSSTPEKLPPTVTSEAVQPKPRTAKRPGVVVFLFGVILPLATFIIELTIRMCASDIFDPMPTLWHELAVGFVPLSNLAIWIAARKQKTEWRRILGVANGFSIGVCVYYSLMFLPLAFPGVIALFYFGFGLLPLTPFIALAAALKLQRDLRKLPVKANGARSTGFWWGLTGAAVVLVFIALPTPLTRYFEHLADSDTPATAAQGIRWLRTFGSTETLLRDCYAGREFGDWIPSIDGTPEPAEKARTMFFRVTGQPFNSVSPSSLGYHASYRGIYDDWSWDGGLGGDAVAAQLKGLSLNSSRLDAKIEPNEAVTYSEWTLEFKNTAFVEREARAQILLPAGGVVSRLTLWVNGEEREAAFGGRSQVRAAYQEVAIQQRHDPVLVTTCGPDRVLMQCFPVPANGGTMKVRIGVTAPLALENLQSGKMRLPVFLERNFGLAANWKHSVWIESKEPLKSGLQTMKADQPKAGRFVLRGELTDAELNDPAATTFAQRKNEPGEVWARRDGTNQIVRQRIIKKQESAPTRVIFVVDGSAGMKGSIPAIAEALRKMPDGLDFAVVLASDTNILLSDQVQKGSAATYEVASQQLEKAVFAGGQDNVPALIQAWELADQTNHTVVLWIHGPQPVMLSGVDGLRQRFEKSADGPRLVDIQTKTGPNRVAEKLDGLAEVVSLPRFGSLAEDLNRLCAGWSGKGVEFGFERDSVEAETSKIPLADSQTGAQVVRLWAAEEVLRLAAGRHLAQAAELAAGNHIVTPYSGAVVLETAAQFARAGLTPADPEKVPTMSTPDIARTFWLFLLAVGLLVGVGRFQRWRASKEEIEG